jgi:hypothetical protein
MLNDLIFSSCPRFSRRPLVVPRLSHTSSRVRSTR